MDKEMAGKNEPRETHSYNHHPRYIEWIKMNYIDEKAQITPKNSISYI